METTDAQTKVVSDAVAGPGPGPARTLVGRYRLARLLGRGGMAEVYDGHDERLGRSVAVKLLRPDMAAHPEVRGRFEVEARAAARLSHPNVVAVFDTGEDGGDAVHRDGAAPGRDPGRSHGRRSRRAGVAGTGGR